MLSRFKWQHVLIATVMLVAIAAAACAQSTEALEPTPTAVAKSPSDLPVSEISTTSGRIWLEAPVGDYQTGWATLSETQNGLQIELDLSPSEPVAQPAHIHVGSCDQLGAVEYLLENVIGGRSVTQFPELEIEDIAMGQLAFNIHLSFADFKTFTACGEIPALP